MAEKKPARNPRVELFPSRKKAGEKAHSELLKHSDAEHEAWKAEKKKTEKVMEGAELPEASGELLRLWQEWRGEGAIPPRLSLAEGESARRLLEDSATIQRERVRLSVRLKQEAKKRLDAIHKARQQEQTYLAPDCSVFLSQDRMYAWIIVFPPMGTHGEEEAASLGNLMSEALQAAGVTTGIDSMLFSRIIRDELYFRMFCIAVGVPAVEGVNGSIVEHFEREPEFAVAEDEKGNVDYHSTNFVCHINAGDVICDILPPQPGVSGIRVTGEEIQPRPVRAAKVVAGRNIALSEDGSQLVATGNGHLKFDNGMFHVSPLLEIRGDVDYSTGNIDFVGDVHIYGGVCESFVVMATGNVVVDGLVEAAVIEAGGDLTIGSGVVGNNQALLRCKGNVKSKYLENCIVYCNGSLSAECIMNSQIYSDDSILVDGGRGVVIGGYLTAANLIKARVLGAQSGRATELEAGIRPCVEEELQHLRGELRAIEWELEEVDKDLNDMVRHLGMEGSTAALAKTRLRKSTLHIKQNQLTPEIAKLLEQQAEPTKPRMEASEVYPGVVLRVKDQHWTTEEFRRACKIAYFEKSGELRETL